jgi:hypothetical protein
MSTSMTTGNREYYTKRRAAWIKSDIKNIATPIEEYVRQVDRSVRLIEDRKAVMRPVIKRRRNDEEMA